MINASLIGLGYEYLYAGRIKKADRENFDLSKQTSDTKFTFPREAFDKLEQNLNTRMNLLLKENFDKIEQNLKIRTEHLLEENFYKIGKLLTERPDDTLKLKGEVFTNLKQTAKHHSLTPEAWIEIKIRESLEGERKKLSKEMKRKAWEDFIGAAAQLPEPKKKHDRTRFGEIIAKKLRKQGLKLEYDAD